MTAVPRLVLDHLDFLKALTTAEGEKAYKKLIRKSTDAEVVAVALVLANVYNQNVRATPVEKRYFRRRKAYLKQVVSPRSGPRGKRKLLQLKRACVVLALQTFLRYE